MEKLELSPEFVKAINALRGELKEPVKILLPAVWNVQVVSNGANNSSSVFVNGKFAGYCGSGAYTSLTVLSRMLDSMKPTRLVNLTLEARRMIAYTSTEITSAVWS